MKLLCAMVVSALTCWAPPALAAEPDREVVAWLPAESTRVAVATPGTIDGFDVPLILNVARDSARFYRTVIWLLDDLGLDDANLARIGYAVAGEGEVFVARGEVDLALATDALGGLPETYATERVDGTRYWTRPGVAILVLDGVVLVASEARVKDRIAAGPPPDDETLPDVVRELYPEARTSSADFWAISGGSMPTRLEGRRTGERVAVDGSLTAASMDEADALFETLEAEFASMAIDASLKALGVEHVFAEAQLRRIDLTVEASLSFSVREWVSMATLINFSGPGISSEPW